MENSLTDAFLQLNRIMNELREKCPWDRKQTIRSLRQLTIEETYELADAISEEDWTGIREELGDLLLHIFFYAKIGTEQGRFNLEDVIRQINTKLISRHPHIYGDVQVKDEEAVKSNWEKLKLKEGKKSVLGGVPSSLPSVVKAMRLQEKARQVGFEWENADQVWEKVEEEIMELKEEVNAFNNAAAADSKNRDRIEDEFGDLMFSLINYARFLQIDAEHSLEKTNKKFISRFTAMEKNAGLNGKNLQDMSLEEMDAIWVSIKKQSKGN